MFNLKKGFLNFISFRLLAILFTLNIFPKIQRGFGDARYLIGQYDNDSSSGFDKINSIFAFSSVVNKIILTSLLPNALWLATVILSIITTLILWKNLREFLLQKNSILLWIAIFFPGYCVYTILPSKEAIFISFSIIYVCFEAKNIVFKPIKKWNEFHLLLQRIIYLSIAVIIRGIPTVPYIFLGIFVSIFPLVSPFLLKYKNRKSNYLILISLSIIFTFLCIGILIPAEHPYFLNKSIYLQGSFLAEQSSYELNLSRQFLLGRNPFELINFIQFPYLSLFPTIREFSSNPKLFIYILESIMYIGIYLLAWKKVINTSLLNPRKIKFIQYLFISITISYIVIYSIIGAFNLGSALRFRQNFSNIGHILPLVIFFNGKRKQYLISSKSLN